VAKTSGKGPTKPTSRVGRPKSAESTGRFTRPIPRSVRRSSRAYGIILLLCLVGGLAIILLNYLTILPGGASPWYLVFGLVVIFTGLMMAMRYR
jgi:hypothetical protein